MAEQEKPRRENDDLSPEAVRKAWEKLCETASERICYHCVNMVWPKRLETEKGTIPWRVVFPVCADHPDSPGVPAFNIPDHLSRFTPGSGQTPSIPTPNLPDLSRRR